MPQFADKRFGIILELPSPTEPGKLMRNNGDILPWDYTTTKSSSRPSPYGRQGSLGLHLQVGDSVEFRVTKDRRANILNKVGASIGKYRH